RRKLRLALLGASISAVYGHASGQNSSTWLTATGTWSTSANWSNGVPNANSLVAVFQSLPANATISLIEPIEIPQLDYLHPTNASARTLTVLGNSSTSLTFNGGSSDAQIVCQHGAGPIIFSLPVQLAGTLDIIGNGTASSSSLVTFNGSVSGNGPV